MDKKLFELFSLQKAIREFFGKENFLEVSTPPMVPNPGMEVHLHPFKIHSVKNKKETGLFLQTSPEFYMKELLSKGFKNIFTMAHSFRDEPSSTFHRPQFIMLEWYRSQTHYSQIMDDFENLINYCHRYFKENNLSLNEKNKNGIRFERKTIQELFGEVLKVDILAYLESPLRLKALIQKEFKDVPVPKEVLSFEDYFFLLFLNKIEPLLEKEYPFLFLYEYPAPLKALSTLKKEDNRVCERFELYAHGIELGNCFQELCDLKEQKKRFQEQAVEKKSLYDYTLPRADVLFHSLERGLAAPSGIAVGVERLLKILSQNQDPFL